MEIQRCGRAGLSDVASIAGRFLVNILEALCAVNEPQCRQNFPPPHPVAAGVTRIHLFGFSQSLLTSAATRLLRRHDDIILFAFPKAQEFAVLQVTVLNFVIVGQSRAFVNTDSSSVNVFARLAFA